MTTTTEAFDALAVIDLATLDRAASLRTRVDRKYVVARELLPALATLLGGDFAVLDIGGRRQFTYRNVYFDSPRLDSYRDHIQGRRRRYKVRVREYVETGVRTVEVKVKGGRGQTLKRRREIADLDETLLAQAANAFLREVLQAEYGLRLGEPVAPTLAVDYLRSALASVRAGQRLTVDVGLRYASHGGTSAVLGPEWAIVETKTASQAPGAADRALLSIGARPVSPLSKYVAGVALTTSSRGSNEFRRTLRRYFDAEL